MSSQKNKNDNMSRQSRNKTDNPKTPGWQFVVIGILLVILIYLIMKVFSTTQSNSDERMQNPSDSVIETMDTTTTESSKESNSENDSSETSDSSDTDEEETTNEEKTELEETAPSDDLVIQAYTGDWDPVATSQEGEHTSTNFSEGSADRIEIKKASSKATGLNEGEMVEWWVGNDGPNRVLTTVSDKNQTSIYRVYMEWVEDKGWKPTKIEKLKENDKN